MTTPQKHAIEILIAPDGQIQSTVTGVAGPACDGIAEWIARLGRITASENTEEYYQEDEQSISHNAGY